MRKTLPTAPNLSYLKKQAKQLKNSVDRGDFSLFVRIAEHLPRHTMGGKFSLSDAQFVVAREYGYSSWPELQKITDNTTDKD